MNERGKFEKWYRNNYWDFKNKGISRSSCEFYEGDNTYSHVGVDTAWKSWQAALSAAPTQPEVEPVGEVQSIRGFHAVVAMSAFGVFAAGDLLYTSPPSPKAEWSADGEPMNLRAAAEDLSKQLEWVYANGWENLRGKLDTLRKFLGEES